MKIIVELSTPEELLQFFETMDPTQKQVQYKKPEVIPAPAAPKQREAPAPAPEPAPAAPKRQKAVRYEDVQKAATAMMDAGKREELKQLLQKHGLQALPELKNQPDKLAGFAADLGVA